jgi:hypothetical protein
MDSEGSALSKGKAMNCNEIEQAKDDGVGAAQVPIVTVKSRKAYDWERALASSRRQPLVVVWQYRPLVELSLMTADWRFTDEGMRRMGRVVHDGAKSFGIRKANGEIGRNSALIRHLPAEWVVEQMLTILADTGSVESWESYYRRTGDTVAIRAYEHARKHRSAAGDCHPNEGTTA